MRFQYPNFHRTVIAVFLFGVIVLISGTPCLFGNQDIWLVDTRTASWNSADEQEFGKIRYFRLIQNRWERSDAATFFETQEPQTPLVVYTPGYTSTMSNTIEIGLGLTRLYDPTKTHRTVFWHWPSEKIYPRLGHDIGTKIPIACASGEYQAMFLQRLKPESKVALLGFSFGNRVICDAVAKWGVGNPTHLRIRLVLTASATDRIWLADHSRHGDVPKLAEKILILFNPLDRVLKFYPLLYKGNHAPDALGRFGPPMQQILPEYRDRIEAINIQGHLGPKHRTIHHLETRMFRSWVNDSLLFSDTP